MIEHHPETEHGKPFALTPSFRAAPPLEVADMSTTKARQIVLAARPQGKPKVTDF